MHDEATVERLLYAMDAVPRAGCSASTECGGGVWCAHRCEQVSRDAAYAYRFYDEPRPPLGDAERVARSSIERLLRARAPPSAWRRCGVSAELLVVLDYSIDALVRTHSVLLEHLVPALELDWRRLLALGFTPSLLAHRYAFPVVVLAREPVSMNATRLLRAFSFEYSHMVEWALTHEELCVLGFDAVLLHQLGMGGSDVLDALVEPTVRDRGARWWRRAMHYTPAMHRACFERTHRVRTERHQTAYMQLTLAMRGAATNRVH